MLTDKLHTLLIRALHCQACRCLRTWHQIGRHFASGIGEVPIGPTGRYPHIPTRPSLLQEGKTIFLVLGKGNPQGAGGDVDSAVLVNPNAKSLSRITIATPQKSRPQFLQIRNRGK